MISMILIGVDVLLLVFVIALFDYYFFVLLNDYGKCGRCGYNEKKWWSFLPATALEVFCVLGGMFIMLVVMTL